MNICLFLLWAYKVLAGRSLLLWLFFVHIKIICFSFNYYMCRVRKVRFRLEGWFIFIFNFLCVEKWKFGGMSRWDETRIDIKDKEFGEKIGMQGLVLSKTRKHRFKSLALTATPSNIYIDRHRQIKIKIKS
jgi:hypothetical protein